MYARVSTPLMNRWLFGSKTGEAVIRRQLPTDGRSVTFLDFVEALAVRAIRLRHKVPLQKIRQAIDSAEQKYCVTHLFAREHVTYLFQKELVITLGDDRYVQVSGEAAGNLMIPPVVELYMRDLTFNSAGLATQYRAFEWRDRIVTMDPEIRFGEPSVPSCGYTAQSLWESFQCEGSIEATAEAYGVAPEDVEVACRYYDHLQARSAV